jgi:hypothetical protein
MGALREPAGSSENESQFFRAADSPFSSRWPLTHVPFLLLLSRNDALGAPSGLADGTNRITQCTSLTCSLRTTTSHLSALRPTVVC